MKISESYIDDAVHAAMASLKRSGCYFTTSDFDALNDAITTFVRDECGFDVSIYTLHTSKER
ncbi:MAG: hypothetical protein ABNH03_16335 [Alteromonas sp.]|jgi:hypothetical protein|uniref:hypothetical protein n=1 Tax=Alteromonas sp. TaxID=232 RepID=UPI0032D94710|tara:strand:- start:7798 stop:7983 length:186 start_codon:yes stop_codon:yes gene_type:complete